MEDSGKRLVNRNTRTPVAMSRTIPRTKEWRITVKRDVRKSDDQDQ